MIFKVLYDFLCIAPLPGRKNGDVGRRRRQEAHSAKDFLFIIPEKLELTEEERYDQDDELVAKDQYQQTQDQSPFPVIDRIELQPLGNASGYVGSEGSGSGECAKDQYQLLGGDFPFLLQALKHGAKRRKKTTARPLFELLNLL